MSSEVKKMGKRKTEKKYLSVIFVPHSHDNIKVFKFLAVKSKLFLISALFLTALIVAGICVFIVYTVHENQKLKTDTEKLIKNNLEQKNMLNEKTDEIKELKDKDDAKNNQISECNQMFKDITDRYIERDSEDSKTNRSGDRSERSFAKDINKLKDALYSLNETNGSRDEAVSSFVDTEEKLKKYIATIPTLWPTSGRISSYFGERTDPFNYDEKFHAGLDIAADYGQDIVAAGDGVITFADWYSGYGRAVIIDHGHGITTVYGHTSEIIKGKGKKVKKGDLIARVGSSGRSTGSHLHFEVRVNGEPVNPLKYLD